MFSSCIVLQATVGGGEVLGMRHICKWEKVVYMERYCTIQLPHARPTMHCIPLVIGASLSEPHIDGTTGRNHICIIVRPSPARRAWSHEVCRASNIAFAYMASVTARESPARRAWSHEDVGLPISH